MAKAKFQIPQIQSKTVTPSYLANFKTRLNKLVPYGFSTIQDIMEKPNDVVTAINTIVGGQDPSPLHIASKDCKCIQCKTRAEKRYFYTAVFYVLADTLYTKTENPLYEAFQMNKQNYNSH